jgi:autotransporter-associated beta strand protein
MNKNANSVMIACVTIMLAASSALATDGTIVVNNAGYNSTNGWLGGIIAGDAGSTMTLAIGISVINVNTNVVLGTIQLAKANVQTDISINISGAASLDEYSRYYAGWGFTLDSGSASVPAQILLLPEDTQQTRMIVNTPIRLNSDLYISYRYKVPTSDNRGPFLHFMAPITENVPGRSVTINSTSGYAPVVFTDRNTFSGALRISNGVLRVDSATLGVGGDQGQLGLGSSIYVSTNSSLNLFGYDGGQGKTLYLTGSGPGGYGAFGSSCGLPNHTSIWHGAVILTGNTAMGPGQGGGQYTMSRWGTVAIDGPISEQGGSYSLEKVRNNLLILNRANSYSGGTKLTAGLFSVTNANALGSGPLLFNGGSLFLTSDLDLSQKALITTNSKSMFLEIAEGVTATQRVLAAGSNVKDGLNRYGRGTWVLAANGSFASTTGMQSYWYEGTTIADYSTFLTNKLPTGGAFRMAGATFLFKNNPVTLPGSFTQVTGGLYLETGKASVISNLTHRGEISVDFGTTLSRSGAGATLILGGEEGTVMLNKANVNGICPDGCVTYGPDTWACVSNSTVVAFKNYAASWLANSNVDVVANGSVPDATTLNSLRFNTAADVTVDQTGSLNLVSGGILVTPNVDTNTVTIQGGTITSGNAAKDLVVHQHNSGTLVMKSTIASNGTSLVTLTKTGQGTLVLDCTNMTLASSMYITGGTVEFRRTSDLNLPSATPSTNTTMTINLCGGGIRFAANSDMINFYPNISTPSIKRYVNVTIGPQGGVIDVPEGRTVTNYSFTMNGPFIKRGKGTLTFINGFACGREDYPFTIEEGAVAVTAYLSSQPMRVIAKPGVTLKSGYWLWGRNWGRADMCDAVCLEIQKGDKPVTIDLNGVSGAQVGNYWAYTPNHDYLEGNGDLIITNSSVTAATYTPSSSIHRKFKGTITLSPNVWISSSSGGFGIPNGTLVIPQGVTANFASLSPTLICGFGALTGNGALTSVTEYPRAICVGDDRTNTVEYTGFLKGYFSGAGWLETPTNGVRFIKTGTSTVRVSGATNVLNHQTVVRKGTLLAGNNSNGTGPGAFGKGAILLGDDKSDANSSLSFLTDGGYTISNSLVQGTMDSSITMSVGGNSTTVASRLTSNLLLSRALCLHSAGGDVTFSGAITGTGGITKTGVGTVYLTGVVSNTGPTVVQAGSLVVQSNVTLTNTLTVAAGTGVTATLAVTGNVTLGTGATLAVSAGSLVRGQTYTFMTWTGTQTGTFAPTTGLPENWRVKYLSNSAVLYYAPPGTMIRVL